MQLKTEVNQKNRLKTQEEPNKNDTWRKHKRQTEHRKLFKDYTKTNWTVKFSLLKHLLWQCTLILLMEVNEATG